MNDKPAVERPWRGTLRITTADDGLPSILLNGMEISNLVYTNGFKIESDPDTFSPSWKVTMVFGAGDKDAALDLDIDIDVLQGLLAAKEGQEASGE